MIDKRQAIVTTVIICALAVIGIGAALLFGGTPEPTPADELITYLDENDVDYSNRAEMLGLADVLCEMRRKSLDTGSYLRVAFVERDAWYIELGVFNGGYCDR